jgi:hypothetical protein
MQNKKFLTLLVLSAGLATTALALVSASNYTIAKSTIAPSSQPRQTEPAIALPHEQLRSRSLMSPLRAPLAALGDRLEKPGKERIGLTGTQLRAGSQQATAFAVVWERPGRLRLEEYGSRQRLAIFDGQAVSRSSPAETSDDALLETLLYDSAEHFFVSQMQGSATRFLGERFRLIEDSETEHEGPFYDLFEVTEQVLVGGEVREQSRQYFFNCDTHLLDLVRYEVLRGSEVIRVEVRLEKWQQVNGQRFPERIVRVENDVPKFTLDLNLNSVTVNPKANDGLFTWEGSGK